MCGKQPSEALVVNCEDCCDRRNDRLQLLKDTLDRSLVYLIPPTPASYTGRAYVPLTLTLNNPEPVAVELEVTVTLPAGFSYVTSTPLASVNAQGQVVWHITLAANATQTLDWSLRAPLASGVYSGQIEVKQFYGATSVQVGSTPLTIEVKGIDVLMPKLIADLKALTFASSQEREARDHALDSLAAAQGKLATAEYDNAIESFAEAVKEVQIITRIPVTPYRLSIDAMMKETQRRWVDALPPCPARPQCRAM